MTDPTPLETELLSRDELAGGVRLACQARPLGEVEVAIEEEILEKGGYTEVAVTPEPPVEKAFLELPLPAPHDDLSDLERIRQTLGRPLWAAPPVLRGLPAALRDAGFRATVAIWDHGAAGEELLAVEAGDTRGRAYGIAFDVGTTSVVGYLIDLFTGREIARSSRLNGQQPWGADVISRATHALEAPRGVADLQAAAIGTLNQIIADCCADRGSPRGVLCHRGGQLPHASPGARDHARHHRGESLRRGHPRSAAGEGDGAGDRASQRVGLLPPARSAPMWGRTPWR